jgi:hypothetical protein
MPHAPGRHQNRNRGRDHLGILGEIKSVHPGEIIGIRMLFFGRLPQEEQLMLKSFGDDYANTWSKPIGWCPEFAERAVPAGYIRLNLGN